MTILGVAVFATRSVHGDKDDLGLGDAEDSATTGHSGKRIACAIIGRTMECDSRQVL